MSRSVLTLVAIGVFSFSLGGIEAVASETFARAGDWRLLGSGPTYADLGAGIFDFDDAPAVMVQVRLGEKLGFVGPLAGVTATTDESLYGYLGIYGEIAWHQLIFMPQTAVGAYRQGDGKDLGGTFQFRSALTVAWQFPGASRLGLQIAHTSNADLHNENPGADEIYLTFSYPF